MADLAQVRDVCLLGNKVGNADMWAFFSMFNLIKFLHVYE